MWKGAFKRLKVLHNTRLEKIHLLVLYVENHFVRASEIIVWKSESGQYISDGSLRKEVSSVLRGEVKMICFCECLFVVSTINLLGPGRTDKMT